MRSLIGDPGPCWACGSPRYPDANGVSSIVWLLCTRMMFGCGAHSLVRTKEYQIELLRLNRERYTAGAIHEFGWPKESI